MIIKAELFSRWLYFWSLAFNLSLVLLEKIIVKLIILFYRKAIWYTNATGIVTVINTVRIGFCKTGFE